ncbi:hypothetical protein N7519_004003 [Penicillium mononematosum]|uniref:uncharacterized protein n=1 Tax=Penicillium mononematosum TaxID=268346 RepID=UPI002549519B|nr:uncharacterized protein N7519_004003 [Penicillium mononematosum]KAJ6189095.1 hypothetical protein N7519_004003 [Penicillium mononematosum]
MSLSVEAIIAIIALFVASIQPLCTVWTFLSRKNSKRETLPTYTIGNSPFPHISQDLRWQPCNGRSVTYLDDSTGLYYKARKWEWEYYTKHAI